MFASRVTLTTSLTSYSLFTLMKAVDATSVPWAQQVIIQVDPSSGGANLYVGNVNISSTNYGWTGSGGAGLNFQASTNAVQVDGIYLLCDTNGTVANIIANVN